MLRVGRMSVGGGGRSRRIVGKEWLMHRILESFGDLGTMRISYCLVAFGIAAAAVVLPMLRYCTLHICTPQFTSLSAFPAQNRVHFFPSSQYSLPCRCHDCTILSHTVPDHAHRIQSMSSSAVYSPSSLMLLSTLLSPVQVVGVP